MDRWGSAHPRTSRSEWTVPPAHRLPPSLLRRSTAAPCEQRRAPDRRRYGSAEYSSYRLRINLIILSVGTNEAYPGNLFVIPDRNDHPVFVPPYIEDHTPSFKNAGCGDVGLQLIRGSPCRF